MSGAYSMFCPVEAAPWPVPEGSLLQMAHASQSGFRKLVHFPFPSCFEAQRWLMTTSAIGEIPAETISEMHDRRSASLPYFEFKLYHSLGKYPRSSTHWEGGGNHAMSIPASFIFGTAPFTTLYQPFLLWQLSQLKACNMMWGSVSPMRGAFNCAAALPTTSSQSGPSFTSSSTESSELDAFLRSSSTICAWDFDLIKFWSGRCTADTWYKYCAPSLTSVSFHSRTSRSFPVSTSRPMTVPTHSDVDASVSGARRQML
mmetsp:Transcript_12094/g.34561  ORF Transcript_12094/g.34561 Transcript_12094/m.34561 type:complete len:258 (-) Transcript_12094:807-1580(-)